MAFRDVPVVRRLISLARNSPWLAIALGLHLILGAAMSVFYLHQEREKAMPAATAIGIAAQPVMPVELPATPEPDRTKIPEDIETELVPLDREMAFVPLEEDVPPDFFEEIGTDPTGTEDELTDTSSNIGVGIVGGHRGKGVGSIFAPRGRGTGKGNIRGPVADKQPVGVQEAVLDGLLWLGRHQNEDGSWSAGTLAQHCDPEHPCIPAGAELDPSYDVGMTSLALLAFLGQGISIHSKTLLRDTVRGERYSGGEIVMKGIKWLRARQKPDGSFSDSLPFEFPENETLATMALCEAQALARSRELRRPAQRAIDFLVAAQKRSESGAPWGFGLGSLQDLEDRRARGGLDDETFLAARASVDLSITCWVVMALKSAQTCGFEVPEESLRGALDYCIAATQETDAPSLARIDGAGEKDGFAAHPRVPALAMLIRSFVAQDITDPYLEGSADLLAADVPEIGKEGRSVDFYYWYFATLALNQFDGPDSPRKGAGAQWSAWEKGLTKALLPLQDRTKARECSRGGWLQEARGNQKGRALYNTAMNVLTLEVYYRYANVFGSALRGPK